MQFSLSWTVRGCGGCVGDNKQDVQLAECLAILNEVMQKNGTFKLVLLNAPEFGPQELSIEIENQNAVIMLGEEDAEDYHVRSYTNPTPRAPQIEILGDQWDGRMVCHCKDEIRLIVETFFEKGDVPRDLLS